MGIVILWIILNEILYNNFFGNEYLEKVSVYK